MYPQVSVRPVEFSCSLGQPWLPRLHFSGASRASRGQPRLVEAWSPLHVVASTQTGQALCLARHWTGPRRTLSVARSQRRDDFRFQRRKDATEVEFGQTRVVLADDQLWLLSLPVAAVVMGAVIIGPIIIGLAVSAVAVGVAMSAGAIAFSTLFLPMFMFMGFGALMMSGLGMALFFPKMLSLGIAALGLGVGWGAVTMLGGGIKKVASTGPASARDTATSSSARDTRSSSSSSSTIDVERAEPAIDPEVLEQSRQLREFDQLMAERDEARRMERWRGSKLNREPPR